MLHITYNVKKKEP